MTLIRRKFENLLPYDSLHCDSEVIGFTDISVDRSRTEDKEATPPIQFIRVGHKCDYYRMGCIYSVREIID